MPGAGPVYQPTTVSYEQQGEWTSPTGLLSHTGGVNRARCIRWVTLAFGILGNLVLVITSPGMSLITNFLLLPAISAGLIMVVEGSLDLADTRQPEDMHLPVETNETDIVVIIIGSFLLLVGLVLIGLYLR